MKLISFLIFLFSFNLFAQDGYHFDEEAVKCQRETCIIVDSAEYGFYENEDIDGFKYLNLNIESSLMDMNLSRGCFVGDKTEATDILMALAGNVDAQFANGGHIQILSSKILETKKDIIEVNFKYKHDYIEGTQEIIESLSRCK